MDRRSKIEGWLGTFGANLRSTCMRVVHACMSMYVRTFNNLPLSSIYQMQLQVHGILPSGEIGLLQLNIFSRK